MSGGIEQCSGHNVPGAQYHVQSDTNRYLNTLTGTENPAFPTRSQAVAVMVCVPERVFLAFQLTEYGAVLVDPMRTPST
jgi:hypothetical protein